MTDKYTALRTALAAGLTPGKWFSRNGAVRVVVNGNEYRFADVTAPWKGLGWANFKTADYIAAASPEVIAALLAERDALREALEKLARLGNGDRYGNSIGNMIARDALAMGDTDGEI